MTFGALSFDANEYPYATRRNVVFANKGIVATSQPLAAQAGLDILKKGGNAIDAAIAAAACLTVVEPTCNGVGGDAFALVWANGKLHGLNASGPISRHVSVEALQAAGHRTMPERGVIPVTVPGAPAAWAALSERFGRLTLSELLQPAIEYAQHGYPLSPIVGYYWNKLLQQYASLMKGESFEAFFRMFTVNGSIPRTGQVWKSPELARTLREIADTKAESFYRGALAEQIERCFQRFGGYLRKDDLSGYAPEWVDPIHVHYKGFDVWEIPPNGQGVVALMALNMMKGFDFAAKDAADTYHKQIEVMKLAFVDGMKYVTQADLMKVSVADLLSERYAAERRTLIGDKAMQPEPGSPPQGGTVYLAAADGEGNMVSYIQSNYMNFGSGIVIPGTGIAMQNRGATFSLDRQHTNGLEPGKKTYHTIIPGFLTKGDQPVGPFGVMGGYMQPQGHVQVVMNTIDFQLNPQTALDSPRWQWTGDTNVCLEHGIPEHIALSLANKGHRISWGLEGGQFGRGQIIWRDEHGVLACGVDPRADSAAAAW